MKRLQPDRPLPPYAFVPGENLHPEKPGGHMYGSRKEVNALLLHQTLANNDFCYAIDLYNFGYPWEAHVWWEALWNKAGRTGPGADLLKALIKLAAASVKQKLGQEEAARGHLERCLELLESIKDSLKEQTIDFNLEDLRKQVENCLKNTTPINAILINGDSA